MSNEGQQQQQWAGQRGGDGGRGGGRGRGGGGRGRGAYYKEKYGGGASRRLREEREADPVPSDEAAQWPMEVSNENPISTFDDLRARLKRINDKQYGAYKDLLGHTFTSETFTLRFLHVQSDSYAPPSSIEVTLGHAAAGFPAWFLDNETRRVALADHLNRRFAVALTAESLTPRGSGWSGPKGGAWGMVVPSCFVLERSSVQVTTEGVTARFTLSLPARGRTIMGAVCTQLLCKVLPQIVAAHLVAARGNGGGGQGVDLRKAEEFVKNVEDQEWLREQIAMSDELVGFIGDGSILPRAAGDSEAPAPGAVPWVSPPSLRVTFHRPHNGPISGTGLCRGLLLIAGGGFHGKSTVLQSLAAGVYSKVPGDGREWLVIDPTAMHVQSEDGRAVHRVDISPFIGDLPSAQGPRSSADFSTANASGSTSLAAAVQEAREAGARALLLDEDTCATNFMVRDARMHALISAEPIAPFTSRVRLLVAAGTSVVLVVGASGDYLPLADAVLGMVAYTPHDWTQRAWAIAGTPAGPSATAAAKASPLAPPRSRTVASAPALELLKTRVDSARRANLGELGEWDLGPAAVCGIVEPGQLRFAIDAVARIQRRCQEQQQQHARLESLAETVVRTAGTDVQLAQVAARLEGRHARARPQDVLAAVSRLRAMRLVQLARPM
ncbi:hypothetical protein H9P43_003531 [Blastocladiella emersonii ATCC 22665]|nr:hypothetical protein H9P43_003531 [Blastocladiella emersonii ATCC 22665]